MTRRYRQRRFIFNYADFDRIGDKCAAQVYKEELEKCLREGKPTSIVSKWCGTEQPVWVIKTEHDFYQGRCKKHRPFFTPEKR